MSTTERLKLIIKKQSTFILDLLNDGRIPEELREGQTDRYNEIIQNILDAYETE